MLIKPLSYLFYKVMKMVNKPCVKSLDIYKLLFTFFIIMKNIFFIRICFGTLCLCFLKVMLKYLMHSILCKPQALDKSISIVKLHFISSLTITLKYTYLYLLSLNLKCEIVFI